MRRLCLLLLFPLAFGALSCRGGKASAEDKPKVQRDIKVTDTKVGEGEAIDEAYIALIEYVGQFPDSKVAFDRNDQKDDKGEAIKAPLPIPVGAGMVVKGIDKGLIGMKKGGVREIFIPWEMGYGEKGSEDGMIPPKQDLFYTVKLLDIVPLGKEAEYDFTDEKVGGGREVKEGDKITVHYRGTYVNGMRFDDSRERGPNGTPFTFRVGAGRVIKGMDVGVQGMRVGGKRRLWLPPMLVYGAEGYSVIQGNQVVILEIELLSIA